jgi:hypothetical protein
VLKPRLASLALFALSVFTIYALVTSKLLNSSTQSVSVILMAAASCLLIFSVIGAICGMCGLLASFLAKPAENGRFVPRDSIFMRLMMKMRFISVTEEYGYCLFSFAAIVPPLVIIALAVELLFIAYKAGPAVTLLFLAKLFGLLLALAICIYFPVLMLKAAEHSRIAKAASTAVLTLLTIGLFGAFRYAMYFGFLDVKPLTRDDWIVVSALGATACIAGLLVYLRKLASRLSGYADFCPKYIPRKTDKNPASS